MTEGVIDGGLLVEQTDDRRLRPRLPFSPWHLFLFPLLIVMLFPVLWMVLTSIELPAEARHFPPILVPKGIHWQNYPKALRAAPLGRFLLNTGVVAAATVGGNLLFCSMSGYAFARISFWGREVIFFLLLATLMVPFQVTLIPSFLIIRWLGANVNAAVGIDSLGALILPNLVTVFGVFMLRQFFRTLPVELEEAARIDGASRLGVLFKIILPLSAPALATLAALTFLASWNDFIWPLVVIQSPENMTVQLGLATFQGAHSTAWTLLMAANVISLVPMLVVFFAAQRYFVRSVATTGLKG
ncbi:MAG: carbohydrate ABC transporter permease [Actinomycetota bacterium]